MNLSLKPTEHNLPWHGLLMRMDEALSRKVWSNPYKERLFKKFRGDPDWLEPIKKPPEPVVLELQASARVISQQNATKLIVRGCHKDIFTEVELFKLLGKPHFWPRLEEIDLLEEQLPETISVKVRLCYDNGYSIIEDRVSYFVDMNIPAKYHKQYIFSIDGAEMNEDARTRNVFRLNSIFHHGVHPFLYDRRMEREKRVSYPQHIKDLHQKTANRQTYEARVIDINEWNVEMLGWHKNFSHVVHIHFGDGYPSMGLLRKLNYLASIAVLVIMIRKESLSLDCLALPYVEVLSFFLRERSDPGKSGVTQVNQLRPKLEGWKWNVYGTRVSGSQFNAEGGGIEPEEEIGYGEQSTVDPSVKHAY
jgi:hypothetical protein